MSTLPKLLVLLILPVLLAACGTNAEYAAQTAATATAIVANNAASSTGDTAGTTLPAGVPTQSESTPAAPATPAQPILRLPAATRPLPSTSASVNTAAVAPQAAATADWNVYHNTKYGYSFHYPKSFLIFEGVNQSKPDIIPATATSEEIFFLEESGKEFLFCCEPSPISISIIKGVFANREWDRYLQKFFNPKDGVEKKSQSEVIFGGHKAFEAVGITDRGGDLRSIIIPNQNFAVEILNSVSNNQLRDSIIGSFKFE